MMKHISDFNTNKTMYDYMRSYRSTNYGNAYAYGLKRRELFVFLKDVDKLAGSFTAMGVGVGDNIAICLPNIPQAMTAIYAANRIGATVSVLFPKMNAEVFKLQLKLTKPKLCLLSDMNYYKYKNMLDGVKPIICPITRNIFINIKRRIDFTPYHSDGEDIAIFMHSSGTSGKPKTSALTNKNLNSLVKNLLSYLGDPYDERDAMLAVLPLFHGFGLAVAMHASLCTRMMPVFVPTFKPKHILRTVRRFNITCLTLIPSMLTKLFYEKNFIKDFKSVKAIYVGGDTVSDELIESLNLTLKEAGINALVMQGYGLTEMGSVCVLNKDDEKGSIGKPLDGVKLLLLDEDGNEAKCGEIAEMCFGGDQLMQGYIGGEDCCIEYKGERYLKSGDLALLDKNGYLYFKGRKKRLIKISGINVFPSEIEKVADGLEEVEVSCAVCKKEGSKPYIHLYVVLKDSIILSDDLIKKIIESIKDNLSHYYIPKVVEQIAEMPYTTLGKVAYKKLEA